MNIADIITDAAKVHTNTSSIHANACDICTYDFTSNIRANIFNVHINTSDSCYSFRHLRLCIYTLIILNIHNNASYIRPNASNLHVNTS